MYACAVRWSFRGLLVATHLGLVAAVVVVTLFTLDRTIGAELEDKARARLAQQARGAAEWIGRARKHQEQLAGRLAQIVDAHVFFVGPDGKRVAYAPAPGAEPLRLEALVSVEAPAADGFVVRLGVPIEEVAAPRRALRRELMGAALVGFGAALALALLVARRTSRPLGAMSAYAGRIARGEYDEPAPDAVGPAEVQVLGRALGSLAEQVRARVRDLELERDRLSAILRGMIEGVLVVGADRRVLAANPSAHALLGQSSALEGRGLDTLALDPALARVIEGALAGEESSSVELPRDAAALVVGARPLALADGRGAVAVLHDVTRLRRLETMRRDFVANVSHELRTPVTAIQGYAETLLEFEGDPARARGFVEIIHRHSLRIARLVADLLRLAELEARPAEAQPREPVALAATVREAVANVRQAQPGGAEAQISVEVPEDLVGRGDADGLEQVVTNLVGNAVRYGRPGGRVTSGGAGSGQLVALSVTDDGPGIAAEHLPRLFERFYRVDAHRSREAGGTGLGRAIVKHLVEAMGGRVRAESAPGAGATFTVELPA